MFYFSKAAFLLLLGVTTPTDGILYGNGDGILVTEYEGLDCKKEKGTSTFIATNIIDEDVACITDSDKDGRVIYYKIHYSCAKDTLTKTYSEECTDDKCGDCSEDDTRMTETWDDWTQYPSSDHCYSQTLSTGKEESWIISSKGYTDWKSYIDTIVDNSCIDFVSNSGDATCDECLPIMEGDDAHINARLWKSSLPPSTYFGSAAKDLAPLLKRELGFIKYTAVATQDPSVYLFYDVFDTEENSKAAHKVLDEANKKLGNAEELLHGYEGTIYWSGGPGDCVKGHQVGEYLSSRLFAQDLDRSKDYEFTSGRNYDAWKDMNSFESFTSSYALDDTESFYLNTFDNEEDNLEANIFALANTSLDPTISLIANTVGKVAFDFTCSDDNLVMYDMGDYDGMDGDCMTIKEIVDSNEELIFLRDVIDSVGGTDFTKDKSSKKWTLFAPSNDAFDKLDKLGALDGLSKATGLELLHFHAVSGKALYADDLPCTSTSGDSLTEMANGINTRTVCYKGDPIGQKGGKNDEPASFVETDIETCNGVIHIVDQVLLYPGF